MVTSKKMTALSAALLVAAASLGFAYTAYAANMTNTYVRLSTMKTGSTSSVRVVFKTSGAGATSVAVNFDAGGTWVSASGAVNATQTVSSGSCAAETGATALPGTLSASGTGGTATITGVTALSAATTYCVDLTSASAVTNPTAGEYNVSVTAGSDSTSVAVRVITDDQVVVNATVPPTFNFALGSNADSFTTALAPGSVVSTSGVTVTVNTNAKTGWVAWAKDSGTGLVSASQSKTIPSVTPGTQATLAAGTEGYVFGVTAINQGSGAGSVTAATAYDATASGGNNSVGSGLDGTLRQIASSTGTASSAQFTVKERAAISALTPAATDYTDTVTIIGAGSF